MENVFALCVCVLCTNGRCDVCAVTHGHVAGLAHFGCDVWFSWRLCFGRGKWKYNWWGLRVPVSSCLTGFSTHLRVHDYENA